MISSQELIAKIKQYNPKVNESLIQKAYLLSKDAHGNQKRHSGELYFSHPLAVAEILVDLKLDQDSIITALLHDIVEDTEISIEDIENFFGNEIAKLVDGVTKLSKIESLQANERMAENFRKLTIAMSEDIRVLIIKLADRLHNMRTLSYLPSKEKKIKKAKESLEIYAPLAGRIGLNKIKDELQDLSFAIVNHEERNNIIQKLKDIKEKNKNIIDLILKEISELFEKENFDCEISGREKKPYSIWIKMKSKNISFYNLHDIMAFRIITKNISECYRALGIINSNYNMIPGSFDDYISNPKENGYKSLHLAIIGPQGNKIEIQIRDKEMHQISEIGIACHWNYKEKNILNSNKNLKSEEGNQYRWIRELLTLFENSENASDVLKNHKLSLHKNEVFCFTPNGDIFNLPHGASVIDFAYAIHSEIGNSCVSAKVNGIIAPLRQNLENGDQVEIITAKNAKPSVNWIQYAITSKAKSSIRNFIKNEKYNEYNVLGKAILQKFFASKDLDFNEKILEKALTFYNKKNLSDLFFKIADGTISRQEILKIVYPDYIEESKAPKNLFDKKINSKYSLPIEGLIDGMVIKYAGCCNPIPGDRIVGVINTGSGVTIHNQICNNLKHLALNTQRILDVCWKNDSEIGDESYNTQIRVIVENRSGALAEITSVIAKKKMNINHIKTANRSSDTFEVVIDIMIKNVEHLEEALSALRISKKTIAVERVSGVL
jgi:guanosine-3',5'-bis(diphosphate) 3'-pyrophosphohydrolase